MEPEPSLWTQTTDVGNRMWGVVREDDGIPSWGSMKERAMVSLFGERFSMTRIGERNMMRFSDLDLTMYSRTEQSAKRKTEGGTSLPDRVKATLGVILHMATLATDEHPRMGQEALDRVEAQLERRFQ